MFETRHRILASILSSALLWASCTVAPNPIRDETDLVAPDAPVFDQRLRDIDRRDLDLRDFWLPGTGAKAKEPIPLTNRTVADLVERVRGGVVNLYTRVLQKREVRLGLAPGDLLPFRIPLLSPLLDVIPFQIPIPLREQGISLGSGFVMNAQGYILTNAHVVYNATDVRVVLSEGGSDLPAKIVGIDLLTDTALIRIEPRPDLTPLPLGDSDALHVGEMVVAVGNPLGLRHTVTSGLLSAKERILPGKGETALVDLLQTDSAINPGSSGGPLLDLYGEVVGINTAIASDAQLIGFAVPINVAKEVMKMLVLGQTERGWLGATARPLESVQARALGLAVGRGILIEQVVEAGPAQAAGLRQDDVVVGVNGERIRSFLHFRRKLLGLFPDETVRITVLREGKPQSLDVTLAERPAKG